MPWIALYSLYQASGLPNNVAAVSFAAQSVFADAYDPVIASGVESISQAPMGSLVLPGSNPFGADMTAFTKDGVFDYALSPITGLQSNDIIRPATTVETLAALQTLFSSEARKERLPQINRPITTGNASPLSDGKAAILITSSEVANKLGLRPLVWIHTTTVIESAPRYMLTGIIPTHRQGVA